MEIEFNTSRISQPGYSPPANRASSVPSAAPQADSGTTAADLENRLQQIPLVRPDKVAQAKTLVANEKYPPNDVMDRIAILLAIRLRD
jgi:hypothetical protein